MEIAGWLQLLCVEGKRGGNGLKVQERHIPRNKTTNVIVMVLSENDNTLKKKSFVLLNISFPRGQHYSTTYPCDCQGYKRYTRGIHICFTAPTHKHTHIHTSCILWTYFIYWDNWLSLYNPVYFLSHYRFYWDNERLGKSKIWAELWK